MTYEFPVIAITCNKRGIHAISCHYDWHCRFFAVKIDGFEREIMYNVLVPSTTNHTKAKTALSVFIFLQIVLRSLLITYQIA